MAIFGIVSAIALLAVIEVPFLWKKRMSKELTIYTGLMIFGMVLAIMKSMDLPLPNPLDWVAYIYGPASKLVDKVLP
ncbi:hypothetical protein M6D81_18930 [Paenibacillus sp. J5C_2022]|nr:hypothetical protein [Paenibacillus sp. J5C2022]